MKGLFLDDERNPIDATWMQYPDTVDWVVVRTFSEFVKEVTSQGFDLISFDHDLQDFSKGPEMTGYDCLKYLANNSNYIPDCFLPQIVVHSMNPIGKVNILSYWKNYLENR